MNNRIVARAVSLALFAEALGFSPVAAQASQAAANRHPALARELTAAEARADLDTLRSALVEAHGGLYRYVPKQELDRRFDKHRAKLTGPTTQGELIALITEMLADIRDGHTRLEYDEVTTAALAKAPLFPLRLLLEDSRLVVLLNDTPHDSTIRPGMEIESINGHRVRDLLPLIIRRLPGDGFIESGKGTRLSRGFASFYWLLIDQNTEFKVEARDHAARRVTATLPGVLDADRAKNANPVNAEIQAHLTRLDGAKENVALRLVSDPDLGYLRIRGFGGETYRASLDSTFRLLRDKGTKALILDLRGNGGGVDEYGAFLVSQFTDKSFRYFDRIHVTTIRPSFATWKPSTFDELRDGTVPDPAGGFFVTAKMHSGVGEQSPARYPFLGKLIVLLDGGTFSTAADVTATLRHQRRATFVGEESGGGYAGNTSGLNALVTLPNSKLRLRVQMWEYWNALSDDGKGRGTLPDHRVDKRVADLSGGSTRPCTGPSSWRARLRTDPRTNLELALALGSGANRPEHHHGHVVAAAAGQGVVEELAARVRRAR